ncbi:relaxase/mobilization nuclease domain-containing protein [Geomonas nitrogeniifigens]|uniref:TraI/MobA(P) family conjugative relaxase n=1 Tax=Geomonas diazotrophica TaxID=2843197 RepID=UPI001C2C01F1|nr:TraI/MobA(P) family conjugative relaxase [Geomonas nitrogeniifigens]QXE84895.1 relaxase/mobilization nuclease domain-containing protein [Geomonas nitrogeniifigens]
MIAKKVPMRSVGRSDYGGLVKYLTDRQGKHQRLGYVTVSNCQSEEWQVAILEVLNTQARNTRAVSDKTYHLIVSFRAGEEPVDASLKAIEERICNELGYSEHQRVCVLHNDTDNLHFHIAINKIHPIRHTIHDPYYDHTTLAKLCQKLEQQYGLQPDNHQVLRNGSENRAADMEHQAGVQSLLGWIQRECVEELRLARSWAELHAILANSGLKLEERGNGLVITDGDSLGVKASSVSRELSKSKLEKRLGAFEPLDEVEAMRAMQARLAQSQPAGKIGAMPQPNRQNVLRNLSNLEAVKTSGRRYQAQPMHSRYDSAKLYAKYREDQQIAATARAAEKTKIAKRKEGLVDLAKRMAKLKRNKIKAVKANGAIKRVLYGVINNTLREDIRRIKKQCTAERVAVDGRYPWHSWADWLRAKAVEGDPEALAALRARDAATGLKGNTLTGKGGRKNAPVVAERDGVTKKGTVIYHVGSTAVRDDGDRLQISRGYTIEGLQGALLLASEQYGSCIAVNGTEAFKEQVVRVAAVGRLPITFDDAALERHRKELLESGILREKTSGHAAHYCKPKVEGIGRKPPPQGQNRLRELSELGVLHLAGGGQMLLPHDVPDPLERQEPKPDHRVRRDISLLGEVTAGQAAAEKYIAEREAIRLKASDEPKHRRYDPAARGPAVFAGIRKVEGEFLVLLKRDEEIVVLPVAAGTALRLKRVEIGETVTVSANGSVTRTGGRSGTEGADSGEKTKGRPSRI